MELTTPGTLGVKLVVGSDNGDAFVLCHPEVDGPPNLETSIIFLLSGTNFEFIGVLETEIISMTVLNGELFCVNGVQKVYSYSKGQWTEFSNRKLVPWRINDLRVVRNKLFGIGNDGLLFKWEGREWVVLCQEQKGLYLYDVADWGSQGIVVSGENGFLARLEDNVLSQVICPTDTDLTCILPIDAKNLLVTGWQATALITNLEEVNFLDVEPRDLDFLNAVRWQDRILIAASSEILEYRENAIGLFSPLRAALLSTSGNRLWKQDTYGVAFTDDGRNWIDVSLTVDL